jgi:hypothetical protein
MLSILDAQKADIFSTFHCVQIEKTGAACHDALVLMSDA